MSTSTLTSLIWGLLAAAAIGLYVVSRRRPDAVTRPSRVVERLVTGPLLRVALVLAVMWTGWHLFAR